MWPGYDPFGERTVISDQEENVMALFPRISAEERLSMLSPPSGPVSMVLDTDTYNEIDDQFALV